MKRLLHIWTLGTAAFILWMGGVSRAEDGRTQGETILLRQGWRICSAVDCREDGGAISRDDFTTTQWMPAEVPSTVLGTWIRNGRVLDPFFANNLEKISPEPFRNGWWYRCEFSLPRNPSSDHAELRFDGINYRADIWLNGQKIVGREKCIGAFRTFAFDVSGVLRRERNVLAVLVLPPVPGDFTIGFVDWNPTPADNNMGIWREVKLHLSGPISLQYPCVRTHVNLETLASADLTVSAQLRNHSDSSQIVEWVGEIGDIRFSQAFTLAPKEMREVAFTPDRFPQLRLQKPRLWWPHDMGEPYLYGLRLTAKAVEKGNARASDTAEIPFGIREVSDYINPQGHRGYKVNGRRVLIRGGGWVDDIFLNEDEQKLEAQIRYCRHMNLNTLRLEGFWGSSQKLYDLADRYGILLMAGWSCQWEWDNYLGKPVDEDYGGVMSSEDMDLVGNYWRDQVMWLRHHPSIFVWVVGSDLLPKPEMEKRYREILLEIDPNRPVLTSCKSHVSKLSGPSAVKMLGPYEYVTPNYWYLDKKNGGAYGFNTETGPGAQPPVLSSLKRMIPSDHLWPIDVMWSFHCARNEFNNLDRYMTVLEKRYGKPSGVEEFCRIAQAVNYEAARAMFEAFSVNRSEATGVIQWMYNSAWPKMFWQLYDYYLMPNGAFYGTRKACQPCSAVFNYGDRSVYVVNGTLNPLREYRLEVRLLDSRSRELLSRSFPFSLPKDSSKKMLSLVEFLPSQSVCFLDLRLLDNSGKVAATNFYWLSATEDVLDMENTTWFCTPNKSYADFSALRNLSPATLEVQSELRNTGTQQVLTAVLKNSSPVIAFFVELQVVSEKSGDPLLPVFWEDNYVSLLPGETRTLTACIPIADAKEKPVLKVSGWNIAEQVN